jgi:thiamine pyrophosphokinase
LQFKLADDTLPAGSTRGVSNVLTEEQAVVRLSSGVLLAIHQPAAV